MIGEQIRRARLERGLSQNALARRAGMSAAAINKIEAGRAIPRDYTRARLAKALGLRTEAFIGPLGHTADLT